MGRKASKGHHNKSSKNKHQKDSQVMMNKFYNEMNGVYSSCIVPETLDERPSAYRDKDIIIEALQPTAVILKHAKTVLNCKGF
jgi:hypothetical protein